MTILFAGGGTGGHLYPAIAIAEEILKIDPNSRVAFVGTRKKIEARVVPQKGFQFHTIWISGFSRRFTVNNLLFPVKVIVSLIQSFFLIRSVRPDVVLGTGGYVSGPVLFVASLMGIPTDRVISITFVIGSMLAAVGGVLYGLSYSKIEPLMGIMLGLKAFVAAVLGGIGNVPGAVIGGLVIGIVESFAGASPLSTYKDAIAFVILILILLFRPSGIFGKYQPEKV